MGDAWKSARGDGPARGGVCKSGGGVYGGAAKAEPGQGPAGTVPENIAGAFRPGRGQPWATYFLSNMNSHKSQGYTFRSTRFPWIPSSPGSPSYTK